VIDFLVLTLLINALLYIISWGNSNYKSYLKKMLGYLFSVHIEA